MSASRRNLLILVVVIVAMLAFLVLEHKPRIALRMHEHHPVLAWDLGNVAMDAGGGATIEQRSLDMLDMSLEKIRSVYYKHVDNEAVLLRGERRGLLSYLKYKHVNATLPLPAVSTHASNAQLEADANQLLSGAIEKYGSRAGADNLTYAAIEGALGSLNDPYTVFLSPRDKTSLTEFIQGGDFGGIGIYIGKDQRTHEVNVIQPIDGTPASRAGLKRGDVILSVGGKSTKGLDLDIVMNMIRGKAGSMVTLVVRRGKSDVRDFSIEREVITVPSMTAHMISGDIGYIQLYDFGERSAQEVTDALNKLLKQGAHGFILDLRDNGGGLLDAAVDISSKFIADGPIVSRIDRDGHVETDDANQDAIPPHPLVVLVNQYSASASEITAGAIQDSKIGILMGQKTFGKGVVQTIYDLPGGSAIKVTTQRYVTPNGRDINKKGIEPNIVVPMDYRDVGSPSKDIQLQAALRYLKRQIALTQHNV
ncbi:MAG: S41 family peptidase [Candidatus Eremiobacteraeota bacterium]|nr:S41 family peptidase [Candidatus Eremiobacteraeota bacterium]